MKKRMSCILTPEGILSLSEMILLCASQGNGLEEIFCRLQSFTQSGEASDLLSVGGSTEWGFDRPVQGLEIFSIFINKLDD